MINAQLERGVGNRVTTSSAGGCRFYDLPASVTAHQIYAGAS